VALTLGLGLHGLKNGLAPQAGAGDDVALPRDLPAALDALERSTVLRELLGAPLLETYVAIKRHEHAERAALADPRAAWDLTHLLELA
jgi:glutamine synthetase